MKLLLIGASGVLGSRLYNDAIKKKWNVLGTYCARKNEALYYLDLKHRKSIEGIFRFFKPELVILAGGITNVDQCQIEPKLAYEVNVKGSLDIIKKAKQVGAKLVFLSTDYVFDGKKGPYKEEDKPSPINIYGKTKLEVEESIKGLLKDYLIVRTAQIYGLDPRSKNFAIKILRIMKNNKKIYAACDSYSTPTYVGGLSNSILGLIEMKKSGIFNVSGADFLNRYEYVIEIADIFELNKALIEKVKLKDLNLKAERPKRAGLKIDKIKRELGVFLYGCREGLNLLKKDVTI